jgi:hypothetical protein
MYYYFQFLKNDQNIKIYQCLVQKENKNWGFLLVQGKIKTTNFHWMAFINSKLSIKEGNLFAMLKSSKPQCPPSHSY